MNSSGSKVSSKRLVFDRRYGWVIDDWKDPSAEALAGGRGMFCILPLAKALLDTASQSINHATISAIKVLESPELLEPGILQACLRDQVQKLTLSFPNLKLNNFALTKIFPWKSVKTDCSSLLAESQVIQNRESNE